MALLSDEQRLAQLVRDIREAGSNASAAQRCAEFKFHS